MLRRGAARRGIWGTDSTTIEGQNEIGSGLVAHDGEATAMAAKGVRPPIRSGSAKGSGSSFRDKIDKSKMKCSHCGMTKHTKETCFKLVGYPEWWEDNHKPPKENRGRATVAMAAPGASAGESRGGCSTSEHNDGNEGEREARAAVGLGKRREGVDQNRNDIEGTGPGFNEPDPLTYSS